MLEIEKLLSDWRFEREGLEEGCQVVSLPHSPFLSDLDGNNHWTGVCSYERDIVLPEGYSNCRIFVRIGAAMQVAKVYLDGGLVGENRGGYLPFEVELTNRLISGTTQRLKVEVDNRWDPDIPPGKKLEELDFCWYGGLYRSVELIAYPAVCIRSNLDAGPDGNGGVFIRTLEAGEERASLSVGVWLERSAPFGEFALRYSIRSADSSEWIVRKALPVEWPKQGTSASVSFQVDLTSPRLWNVGEPNLYALTVEILDANGLVFDSCVERFGIRRIHFSREGKLTINGKSMMLRGVNRHQDYPYVGYAVPPAAQYRDAIRIKEAGFDFVRLSHYPQSDHFLDACDELGIVVMNCLPGWQFQGGNDFDEACERNARLMIRRDRNHPSVVVWELSLNETLMSESFVESMKRIAKEEYPGDQMYTCGWIDQYDVYMRSRQHGSLREWKNGDKASIVAEYGDWEFYACNEGFNQNSHTGLMEGKFNSRKFRGDGDIGMLQQCKNHMIGHNDNRNSRIAMDALWVMYDYTRGYHQNRAAAGLMDIFRLPKYSYYFFRSQRSRAEWGGVGCGGPMVFIASQLEDAYPTQLVVFSNCQEVELILNGKRLGRKAPTIYSKTQFLACPPFYFSLGGEEAITIEAEGFEQGVLVAKHAVRQSGDPARIEMESDTALKPVSKEGDLVFIYARIADSNGSLCSRFAGVVSFRSLGEGEIVKGNEPIRAEAGIATVLLRVPPGSVELLVEASVEGLGKAVFNLIDKGSVQRSVLIPL